MCALPISHVSVAANYNRKDGDEWKTDTHWNRVTFFRQLAERAADLGKGDLVHIPGRVRQHRYESNGDTRYSVALIVEGLGILPRGADDSATPLSPSARRPPARPFSLHIPTRTPTDYTATFSPAHVT